MTVESATQLTVASVPGVTETPGPGIPGALELVAALCGALGSEGVDYCHWKSNEASDRSASGDNDLDLLVSRGHADRFTEVLHRLGFKQARQSPVTEFPGVLHFLGVDPQTKRFVDVHTHYQLVVGDDMTKNYRLPIERAYLASCRQGPLFRVPAPELELAVLVIRLVIKHATWDAALTFQGEPAASERREVDFLARQTDWARVAAVVEEHLPFLDRQVWDRCVRWVTMDAHRPLDGVRVARDLSRALAAHTRSPWLPDLSEKIYRRGLLFTRRRVLRLPSQRSRLETGGAVIALVGGDGAGKSTAVDAIAEWLSGVFQTRTMHLGKPSQSVVSVASRQAWELTSALRSSSVTGTAVLESSSGAASLGGRGTARLVWEVLTARDRYRSYVRARRAAARGELVVCDRFPLPQVMAMDGAVSARLTLETKGRPAVRRLVALEQRYYRHMLAPDILVVLRVHPDLAVERKRDVEREAFVRPRAEEVWQLDWAGTPAVVVDAGQPRDRVLAEVKQAIWSRL
jgi:thymidylate kinase